MNAALTALSWLWLLWCCRGGLQEFPRDARPDRLRSLPFLNLTRNRPLRSDAAPKHEVN